MKGQKTWWNILFLMFVSSTYMYFQFPLKSKLPPSCKTRHFFHIDCFIRFKHTNYAHVNLSFILSLTWIRAKNIFKICFWSSTDISEESFIIDVNLWYNTGNRTCITLWRTWRSSGFLNLKELTLTEWMKLFCVARKKCIIAWC